MTSSIPSLVSASNRLFAAIPAAADRLAALTRVRDLVATLPPPEPTPDVSSEVVALLSSRRRSSFRTIRFAALIVSGLAAAALLMIVVHAARRPHADPELALAAQPDRPLRHPLPLVPLVATGARAVRPALARLSPEAAIRADVLAAEIRDRDNRGALDSLLRHDGIRVVDVLVDQIGPSTLDILDDVVRTTSRVKPNHARVHVVQGVEIDPAKPGRVYAYVLVMDEHEYAKFRRKLDDRFPASTTEPEPVSRGAMASLSKVGRVEFFRDTPPSGTLTRPPADLLPEVAIQVPKREGRDEVFIAPDGKTMRPRESSTRPTMPEEKSTVTATLGSPPKPSQALVYVVWLATRDRPRG